MKQYFAGCTLCSTNTAVGFTVPNTMVGTPGGAVGEALRYKQEGRGFDSRWCHWKFSLT